ncbi:MAG: hypothetical protein JNJ54_05305 [Myxococcaceae bacterium]|nr:hypothetical protein [Myxococcaceae bacterium]
MRTTLLFLLFAACGVGTVQLDESSMPAPPAAAGGAGGAGGGAVTPDAGEPAASCRLELSAVGAVALSLMPGQQGQVTVLLRDTCTGPVRGVSIGFTFAVTTDSRTDVMATSTDRAGLARVVVTAGGTAGAFELLARFGALEPVRFQVAVTAAPVDPCLNHCSNGAQDCGETGRDCGGSCGACAPPMTMTDDATVTVTAPASLVCMAAGQVTVQVRNTGTTTWTSAAGYRLGFVGGASAPLLPAGSAAQVVLPQNVAPGGSVSLTVTIAAPAVPASYDARFQMQKGGAPFGAIGSRGVSVTPGCAVSVGCTFPQGVPDPDYTAHATTSTTVGTTVNQVMSQLSGCPIGSDCVLAPAYPDAQTWFAAVTAALRARGLCAGQHEVGHTDEIAVSATGCTGLWYGYHAYNYGGGKVVWAPGANRGSWSIAPQHCPP